MCHNPVHLRLPTCPSLWYFRSHSLAVDMGTPQRSPTVLAHNPPFSASAMTRSRIDVMVSHRNENEECVFLTSANTQRIMALSLLTVFVFRWVLASTQLRVGDCIVTFQLLVIPYPPFPTTTNSVYPVSSTVLKL
jgi:hypothetical protein